MSESKSSLGQKEDVWTKWWNGLTPESEIRMWDYYGLRQWITKYTPRFGKVIEAGCGLGRYNFYFSRMGIEMEGVDFSAPTIEYLNEWKKIHGFDTSFITGDVCNLPYPDNSLSSYISLGVVEHFIDGPQIPLKEAFRVLRPGGIAIISTPSVSWNVFKRKLKRGSKDKIKKLIGKKSPEVPFFQYEYRPNKLKSYVEDAGFKIASFGGADLMYSFLENSGFNPESVKPGSLGFWLSNKFEDTFLRYIGAQSIVIGVKAADKMHCFISGEKTAELSSLNEFDVPVSDKFKDSEQAKFYAKGKLPRYGAEYIFNPPIQPPTKKICDYTGKEYMTDELFEDYGFTKNVSPEALKKPEVNLELCNLHIQPIWRKRKVE